MYVWAKGKQHPYLLAGWRRVASSSGRKEAWMQMGTNSSLTALFLTYGVAVKQAACSGSCIEQSAPRAQLWDQLVCGPEQEAECTQTPEFL